MMLMMRARLALEIRVDRLSETDARTQGERGERERERSNACAGGFVTFLAYACVCA